MGASEWRETTAVHGSWREALDAVRERTFSAREFLDPLSGSWGYDDLADEQVETLAQLDDVLADPDVAEQGTHSVLDVVRVEEDSDSQWTDRTVRPVTPEELMTLGGRDWAAVEDLDNLVDSIERIRWVGRCVVLHDVATLAPVKMAFWGHSGD